MGTRGSPDAPGIRPASPVRRSLVDGRIHLDTNFLIQALVSGSGEDRLLQRWLQDQTPPAASVVAWCEFLCGPVGPQHIELARLTVGEPIPLLRQDAETAARLFNLAGRKRNT